MRQIYRLIRRPGCLLSIIFSFFPHRQRPRLCDTYQAFKTLTFLLQLPPKGRLPSFTLHVYTFSLTHST